MVLVNSNFSYTHYEETLLELKKKHSFCFFDNVKENDVILRHDIDISLDSAVRMAELENKLNIKSTYFILLHSSFYNPFSIRSTNLIKKIINLGHQIGLHYDSKFIEGNQLEPKSTILAELELLKKYFKINTKIISAHNPTTNPNLKLVLENEIIDADSIIFKENRKYLSDSVQNWRESSFSEHTQLNNLYVLIHPIWWTDKNLTRNEILKNLENHDLDSHKKEVQDLKIFYEHYLKMIKNLSS